MTVRILTPQRALRALMVCSLLASVAVLGVPTKALALPGCGSDNYDAAGRAHTSSDGDTAGIRGSIQLRTNSNLCDLVSGDTNVPSTSNWIALAEGGPGPVPTDITQIGWIHDDPQYDGGFAFCEFYESGATLHLITPCSYPDLTTRYFAVQEFPGEGSTYDEISDCGTDSTYTSCTGLASSPDWVQQTAFLEAETSYGGQIIWAGSSANRVNYGTNGHPVDFLNDVFGTWAAVPTVSIDHEPGDTDYHKSWDATNNTMVTYDDRNTS
jgi:hypothetical protein